MPSYDFHCPNKECNPNKDYITIQKRITDDEPRYCSKCNTQMEQLFLTTGGGVQLKGDGWFGSKLTGQKKGY